jgi:hypothetical protein
LAYGRENDFAPVFEYLPATARAFRVSAADPDRIDFSLFRAGAPVQPVPILKRRLHSLQLATEGDRPGLLVLREIWRPGWRARVNGRPADLIKVAGLFRAVAVPAGRADVTLLYRPLLPIVLFVISMVILMTTAAVQFVGRKRYEIRQ